jgi:hypothetical protein
MNFHSETIVSSEGMGYSNMKVSPFKHFFFSLCMLERSRLSWLSM